VNCAEFKESVFAYALGALDPPEHDLCTAHLAADVRHESCTSELALALETAASIGLALPPARPSERTWKAIEEAIDVEPRGAAPDRPGPARRRAAVRWREGAAWLFAAAAAAALFFVQSAHRLAEEKLRDSTTRLAAADARLRATNDELLASSARLRESGEELRTARQRMATSEQALALLADPATRLVTLAAQGGAPYHATVLMNARDRRAVVMASALTSQAGKDYELWAIRGEAKIPAGLLRPDETGATVATLDEKILAEGAPDAFAVTIEPQGGTQQPTGPIVLLGATPKA
jgi:hypothetical protein